MRHDAHRVRSLRILLLIAQMQRDQSFSADDRFMFTIDTYADGRSGYYFEINPSGAMGDGLIVPGGGFTAGSISINRSWDGIWNARVARNEDGWTAEIEIPFHTINFDPQPRHGASTFSGRCAERTRRACGQGMRAIRD